MPSGSRSIKEDCTMNRVVTLFSLLILLSTSASGVEINNSITWSLGIPQGEMNFSANPGWRLSLDIPSVITPEFRLGGCFSTRSEAGSRTSMLMGSAYVLGRKDFSDTGGKITLYIAAGPGFHAMYSFYSAGKDGLDFYKSHKTTLLLKAHGFVGIDLDLIGRFFFTAEGRMTLPSDIVIDSGYLGVGLRL